MEGFWNELWPWWSVPPHMIPDGQRASLEIVVRALRGESIYGGFGRLRVAPISLPDMNRFLAHVHRHHKRLQGWKFGAGLMDDLSYVGAVSVGRPVSRMIQRDRNVLEITRCVVMPGIANGASKLLGMACRMAKEIGMERVITYTGEDESGASLRAAGFIVDGTSDGGGADRPSRRREEADWPTGPKTRWRKELS